MNALPAIVFGVILVVWPPVLTEAADLTPRQIYERAAPSVVVVVGIEDQGKGSTGTGAIILDDGLVFTNAHVVMNKDTNKPYSQLLVILKPDRVTGRPDQDYAQRHKARVIAVNRELDLAALRFEKGTTVPRSLPLSDPSNLHIGDWVAAIGHPEQGGLWTLTTGVVSAEFEDFQNTKGKHVFQTEIGMNRGNSGGPLIDVNGHVVGVNTSIARLAPDGLPITSISFSVKSSVLKQWLGEQGIRVAYAEQPMPPPVAPSIASPPTPPVPSSTKPAAPASPVSAPPLPPTTPSPAPKVAELPPASPPGGPAPTGAAPSSPPPTSMAPVPSPPASQPPQPPPAVVTLKPSPAPAAPTPKTVEAPPPAQTPTPDKLAKAKPARPAEDTKPFKTKARPYDPDRLVDDIRRLDMEMEDLAEEMRKKIRPR